jgi:hypothetical protein
MSQRFFLVSCPVFLLLSFSFSQDALELGLASFV